MAGTQDPSDNPVAINVVPMVDVIFCLCVFFMCSFKFKELEGKFETWLPKDKGASTPMPPDAIIQEIRVALFWDDAKKETRIQYTNRVVADERELQTLIRDAYAECVRLNKPDTPVIIDGEMPVPWEKIVMVMNVAKREGINKIEFAFGKDWSKENK